METSRERVHLREKSEENWLLAKTFYRYWFGQDLKSKS